MYERVVYVSEAAPGVGLRDAYDIIRTAHNRNSHLGLTGALLFIDGFFVQALEGDRFHLRERFDVIGADARHCAVQLRACGSVDRLLFPGEWMALRGDADIPAGVKAAFGYAPGLPAAHFDGARTLDFVLACCRLPQTPPQPRAALG